MNLEINDLVVVVYGTEHLLALQLGLPPRNRCVDECVLDLVRSQVEDRSGAFSAGFILQRSVKLVKR